MKKFNTYSLILLSFLLPRAVSAQWAGHSESSDLNSSINRSGYVGIGTITPPERQLVVAGSHASAQLRLQRTESATGMTDIGSDEEGLKFWVGGYSGNTSMIIDPTGRIGIGTIPSQKLEVNGQVLGNEVKSKANLIFGRDSEIQITPFTGGGYNSQTHAIIKNGWRHGQDFTSLHAAGMTPDTEASIVIVGNGNVGIGITNPDAKLTVKGEVHTREVRVDMDGPLQGPDYVFEKDYNLLPLSELEAYINQNKHLPEVPSAKEMEANGLNLKEMNLLLLKKVEELTLHLIEQDKKIEMYHSENQDLKKEILNLRK